MAVLDGSIANVALPTIARELSATPAESIWVVNGFQIAVTATLFGFASLGELAGFTSIYRIGVAVFTLGSLSCALSHTLPLLVLSRVLQGLGASAIMAIQPSMLRRIYPPQLLGRGTGWTALTVATSAAAGPTLGGAILAVAPWPWLFLINVPVGIVLLVMSAKTIPHYPATGSLREYDLAGAFWCGLALSAFTLGVESVAHGGAGWLVAYCFLQSLAAILLFVRRERRATRPLIPLEIFKRRSFTLSSATSVCSYTAQGLAIVSLPYFFQDVLGRTPFEAGLILTPWPLAVAVVAPFAGRLADRKPVWILATSGLGAMALGAALLALLPPNPGIADIVWREAIAGLGFGFFQSPNNRELLSSVPHERSGAAGGMLATARLFGQSVGAALVAVTFGLIGLVAHATPVTLWLAAAIAAGGAAVSIQRSRT